MKTNITCRGCCWFGVAIVRGIYKFGVLLSDRSTPRIYHGMGFPPRCNGTYPFFLFFFFFFFEIFWISRDFVILSSKNVALLLSISSAWSRIWNFSRSFLGSNVLLFFLVEVVCVWSQWMITFFKNWVILTNYLT